MAQQALNIDLKDEAEFLAQFDVIFKAVDERFDVRGNDLTNLVLACLQNNGKVSANRRKKFAVCPLCRSDALVAKSLADHHAAGPGAGLALLATA
jgi:hypothetical protein